MADTPNIQIAQPNLLHKISTQFLHVW